MMRIIITIFCLEAIHAQQIFLFNAGKQITINTNCNVKYICSAGCRAVTYKLEGNIMSYPKTLCKYYKLAHYKLHNISLKIIF